MRLLAILAEPNHRDNVKSRHLSPKRGTFVPKVERREAEGLIRQLKDRDTRKMAERQERIAKDGGRWGIIRHKIVISEMIQNGFNHDGS
jgi:hypothetical protein